MKKKECVQSTNEELEKKLNNLEQSIYGFDLQITKLQYEFGRVLSVYERIEQKCKNNTTRINYIGTHQLPPRWWYILLTFLIGHHIFELGEWIISRF